MSSAVGHDEGDRIADMRARPWASAVRGGTTSGVTASQAGHRPESRGRLQHKRHERRASAAARENIGPLDEA